MVDVQVVRRGELEAVVRTRPRAGFGSTGGVHLDVSPIALQNKFAGKGLADGIIRNTND